MEPNKKKSAWNKLRPLFHLWPGLLVLAVVLITLPMTRPVLREIPALLELPTQEPVQETQESEEQEEPEAEPLEAMLTARYTDGVYTGSAQGYGGMITVQVTVENARITGIEILSDGGETTSFFNRAMGVVETVLSSQTWEVDVISGATYSSRGILGAIENALTGEPVENKAPETKTPARQLTKETFEEPEEYRDGTYYGSAAGFGGTIQVEVVIAQGKISSVRVVSASGETPSYLSQAEAVIQRMVSANSPNVDTVSGATYSSTGIINAVKRALNQAAVHGQETVEDIPDTPAEEPDAPLVTDPAVKPAQTYLDGVYTGTAEGFGGDITVVVTVEEGRISSIQIVSAEDETPAYLDRAKGVIGEMLSGQTTEVDVVSGATYSSQGIIGATEAALKQALVQPEEPERPMEPVEPENPTESEIPEKPEQTRYQDGSYTACVLCTDEELFTYTVQVTAVVESGIITQVQAERVDDQSEYPEDNEIYFDYAVHGRERRGVWYEGVIAQILDNQAVEQVDVVSSATYSSNAIIQAAGDALIQARTEEPEPETPEESAQPAESVEPEQALPVKRSEEGADE